MGAADLWWGGPRTAGFPQGKVDAPSFGPRLRGSPGNHNLFPTMESVNQAGRLGVCGCHSPGCGFPARPLAAEPGGGHPAPSPRTGPGVSGRRRGPAHEGRAAPGRATAPPNRLRAPPARDRAGKGAAKPVGPGRGRGGAGRPAGRWGRGGAAPSRDPPPNCGEREGRRRLGVGGTLAGTRDPLELFSWRGGRGLVLVNFFFNSNLFIIIIRTLNFNIEYSS